MVPVYVLMAGQTWTDLMYRMMDAEYKWSSLYFVFVMVVMNFWILNLFVAVINEMFAKIREESEQSSAFAPHYAKDENKAPCESKIAHRKQAWLDVCEFFWVIVIIVDIVIQCLPRYESPQARLDHIETLEFICSLVFAFDIVTRFLIYLPEYQEFFKSKKNMVDLFLVIATLIIHIPAIRQSSVYKYLTIFRVLRIYRPIIYYERLRSLIERVIGSWAGLSNLILFIGLFLAMVSVMAGFLFREILLPLVLGGNGPVMTFQDFYLSYLGVYQLFSGENWTDILYSAMGAEVPWCQVVFAAVFLIAFYSVANFILVNMLIAIIMENFEEKSDDVKRAQQIGNVVAKSGLNPEDQGKVKVYLERFRKPHPRSIGEQQYNDIWEKIRNAGGEKDWERIMDHLKKSFNPYPKSIDKQKVREIASNSNFTEEEQKIIREYLEEYFYETLNDQEMHRISVRQLLVGDTPPKETETNSAQETTTNSAQETTTGGELSSDHSSSSQGNTTFADKSLLIFSRKNTFRCFLQSFVEPHQKIRDGDPPKNKVLRRSFNAFITLAILASVIVAAITTPVWSLEQSKLEPADRSSVIRITDIAFPVIFTLEFVLRVIADGLLFTPDAYLKSIWNWLDTLVLVSMYVPLFANTSNSRGYPRFFRSLKSLRALRLVNRSSYIKETFHAVLVAGFPQLLSAVMLSLALLIPFAIYGLNLFKGLLFSCNDNGNTINTLYDCRVEFTNSDDVLMPRVWSNPTVYSFDNFFASLLILFEIVSQEGWIDVMSSARDIVGLGMQPNTDASRYNGIFFVLFNLAGGYFVVSLFVATIIENYTKRIGTASMTAPQKAWMDMKKLLRSTKMSKSTLPEDSQDRFCYGIASPKRDWLPRLLTFVTMLLAIALMSEHVNSGYWEGTKNWIYLPLLLFYIAEIFIRLRGLGWRLFMTSRWSIYNSVISITAFITTIIRLCGLSPQPLIQVQKLFLVAILVRLVPQNDKLNQLFTTMVASFKSIASLFSVWLIVFAVYAVMFMEMFGLTAYGPNGSNNVNFRGFGITMLMMARMSTGEGWNDLMHDFALNPPNCVNHRENYLTSDCGSTPWAYSLFISFNVVSMYIFTNMFIVVVMHNFSYVYLISSDLPSINRMQLRSFKETWALFDKDRTGYIQEENIEEFLKKLRGAFDMRIYGGSHKMGGLVKLLKGKTDSDNAILEAYRNRTESTESALVEQGFRPPLTGPATSQVSPDRGLEPYLVGLNYDLSDLYPKIIGGDIDKEKIKRKLWIFNTVYAEAVMSMESEEKSTDFEKGHARTVDKISFEKMLDIVVRNTLLKDDQYFSIAETLRHKKTMDQVRIYTDVVNYRRVLHGFILRVTFLRHYKKVKEIRANAANSNLTGNTDSSQRNRKAGELIEIDELRKTCRNRLFSLSKLSIADKITKRHKKTMDKDGDKNGGKNRVKDGDEDRIDFEDILKTISEMEKNESFKT
uniref:Calcium-channel protein CCH1 n=1 Tax=Entomortierella chlamydospora TaxID=101097 RepID=A0A9P6SZP9_9FUNG|nr:calcium channel protein [Entomortierella chlamydospora]KAG0014337.1 calcium channel protein [Entomortierella chlamydospora]